MAARQDGEAQAVRQRIRSGGYDGQTAGMAPGHVQGNLIILPADWASDFLRFCQANPKPCPLLAVSEVGDPMLPTLGADVDIRTDVPRYRVYRDGELVASPTDIRDLWRKDLVSFLIGCSFSFEEALLADGVPVKHIALGRNVPMYRTNIPCIPAGRFSGPMVVSMRPLTAADAIRAVQITTRFPTVHGAPVHLGRPELIGIKDVTHPDYGEAVPIEGEEMPVFWACGVTPQAALLEARPPLAIGHEPGCMLVTDLVNSRLASL
ncbi:putative hydro-lyase [Telmatospirillum sp.]|uniref:putative hydro-lyase n=1 Tax=Telmatospirillum sp. TaxID=2079197 RepID=UPI0028515986|nr:putative hydro-lyase [Telmatospirillum sp.]MDR3438015.1 putative hydro-lyase [Telmatospirillum sp.]